MVVSLHCSAELANWKGHVYLRDRSGFSPLSETKNDSL